VQNDGTLKRGSLVTVPATYRIPGNRERRTAVVESIALNGLSFTDTRGSVHFTADAVLVPLADAVPAP
jgi:hypothetical protein